MKRCLLALSILSAGLPQMANADTCRIVSGLTREMLERPVSSSELVDEIQQSEWFGRLGESKGRDVVALIHDAEDWLWKHPGIYPGNSISLAIGWCDQKLINRVRKASYE